MLETKRNKIIATTLLFIFITIATIQIIKKIESNKREYYLHIQSQLFVKEYTTWHKYLKIMSQDIYTMYTNNTKLMQLLDKASYSSEQEQNIIRTEVYNQLKKNYKRLEHMGISQVHFHLPNNVSFLRMYAPQDYGDDLSQTREGIVLTNKTLQAQEGFEVCPYLLGYRFIYPLFYKNKHIGSVEISYSDASIIQNLIENFVYDSHVLVSKEIAINTPLAQQHGIVYKKTWESDAYYIDAATHQKIKDQNFYDMINKIQLKQKLQESIQEAKPFSQNFDYNYQQIVVNFLPIPGFYSKNIAYLVTYTKSTYLSRLEIEKNYITLLFCVVIFFFYIFSLYLIISREKLKELALFDPLTQLPNRALFKVEFHNELNRAQRYKRKVALLFIDLDGFKAVNDTYGHHAGDQILEFVANVLSSSIRSIDIASRFAGDEFAVLLSNIHNDADALKVANNIMEKINEGTSINHKIVKVGASIGISLYPEHSQNNEELIRFADKAMYEAKKLGKNRAIIYQNKENN
ncbi:diguanylate cyclase [Sulfurimonas sp.]|uniref:diguanylate cyclase n=1 Tax=Sulfurimonas sp. TaxID=2022749 RepID=UPI0026131EA7|nr:diguanylate cyclase [Sulfurimonas sp.]